MRFRQLPIGTVVLFLSCSIASGEEFISSPSIVATKMEMTGTVGAPSIDCLVDNDGNGIADDVEFNPNYPAACTMLDAPLSTYSWGKRSISTVIRTPEILQVMATNFTDADVGDRLSDPYDTISWVKKTCAKDSSGTFCLPNGDGSGDYAFKDVNGMTDVHSLWFTDVFVPDLGNANEVLAFMHEERVGDTGGATKLATEGNHGMTRLGLAWSEDYGNTWSYLGRIISTYLNEPIINIQGSPYLIVGNYIYVYYKEDDGPGRNVGVARALISEVVAAAKANTPGVSDWHKYVIGESGSPTWDTSTSAVMQGTNTTDFTDSNGVPVIVQGGSTPIFKPVLLNLHNGVVHTQTMRVDRTVGGIVVPEYFIVTAGQTWGSTNTQILLYRSDDGLLWTDETVVDAEVFGQVQSAGNTSAGGYLYCTTLPTDGRPNHISSNDRFYIYCQDLSQKQAGENEPSLRSLYRWEVNLNVGEDNSFKNSQNFDGTQGPEWSYYWGENNSIVGQMNWNSVLWSSGQAINRIRTSPVPGLNGNRADYVGNTQLHPGASHTPILRWTAPKDGTVNVDGVVRDANPNANCGDGVEVSVIHNTTLLFNATIDNADTVGVSIAKGDSLVEVLAGDHINFLLAPRSENSCDSTTWDPSVMYRSPVVTEPVSGTTLAGSADTISWVANGVDATQWWLYAGSVVGGAQHFDSGILDANVFSSSVSSLPVDGSTIYVRLWYLQAGSSWKYIDTTYMAPALETGPMVYSPAAGATLGGATETFMWTGNSLSVDDWWLYAGSSEGANDFYNSGTLSSTSTSVTGLPTDGSTVYVRLWYKVGGSWVHKDSSYTAATIATPTPPAFLAPTHLSVLASGMETFSWTANSAAVDEWWITMGSIYGSSNIYSSGLLTGVSSVSVSSLPVDGSGIYVRLWYRETGAAWSWSEAYYTAATLANTVPEIIQPVAGSTLSGSADTFSYVENGTSISEWWLYAGSSVGGNQHYDSGLLNTGVISYNIVTNLPTDGSTVYVRFWYKEVGDTSWKFVDTTYLAASQ